MAKGNYAEWLTDDGLLRIKGWARDGLTDKQIAGNMGISRSTFYEWQRQFSSISDALKEGKAPVDIEVENALLKSALGFITKIKKPIKVKIKGFDDNGRPIEEEQIKYATEEVFTPPQTTAQIFWLKNRRPDKWRDKPVPEVVQVASPIDEITQEIFKIQQEQREDDEE